MRPQTLLAKSARGAGVGLSLLAHTIDVVNCAKRLYELTGRAQLCALGLELGTWGERYLRDLTLCAFLHDLGKANSYFQALLTGSKPIFQPIRHEAVSYWIARRIQMREWLQRTVGDLKALELILLAVAGHHRKFPPGHEDAEPMVVYLGHEDFHAMLEWGSESLGLASPPRLDDATIRFSPKRESVILELEDAECEALGLIDDIKRERPEEIRYLALLKASLIAADVAGSIRRQGGRPMVDWMADAFSNVPTATDLDGVVRTRLGIRNLHPFQQAVGEAPERVVLVRAGCGSGKSLAAYHWAARAAERLGRDLRVFFCYPTTGTASEGYRDYLKDVDLPRALIHGRSEVDMELLGLGDDEPGPSDDREASENEPGRATVDSAGALDHWSTPLVSCTVDTVLGLVQNNRRGIYLWPSVAGSAVVFDEVHSYDDRLFEALLRFLKEMRGIPCLLMTASLPESRLRRLKDALSDIDEGLGVVPGPDRHESIKRYKRESGDPRDYVKAALAEGGKVLWVVNTVDRAMDLWSDYGGGTVKPLLYHSRFKYRDRVKRHGAIIQAFGGDGPVLAFTTQVAEMSLDLSASLLVTQLAPVPALIQRLGRLNRRASEDDPWPFVVYGLDFDAKNSAPYDPMELNEARAWLESLGPDGLSQRDLVEGWRDAVLPPARSVACAWLDGGFETRAHPLRTGSPGIEIILPEDVNTVRSGGKPEEYRIPMLMPRDRDWHRWDEVAFCKVPPTGLVEYHPMKGARWTR